MNPTLYPAFPNLVQLAALSLVLPVTTATVERTFSDMKLTKPQLRSRLGEDTLDQTLRLCTEGPPTLSGEDIDSVVRLWKKTETKTTTTSLVNLNLVHASTILFSNMLLIELTSKSSGGGKLLPCPPPHWMKP